MRQGKSMQDIAHMLKCSVHQVRYWMDQYVIPTRSISEAVYLKCNPDGDPFSFTEPKTIKDAILYGMGIGLYWGEGTKANRNSVRLGNTDPKLLKKFIDFLVNIYNVKKSDMKFGLQIFTDIDIHKAVSFWVNQLGIHSHQIYKPIITKSGSLGTYRKKSEYGVLTVFYSNTKLRNLLVSQLPM